MSLNPEETFGSMVFNENVMKQRLPKDTYKSLKKSITFNKPLEPDVADIVANALKDWAIQKGATHFIHWFQPMTNITAGKLDAFLTPQKDGSVICEFSGKELVKGEPDASSFPNGGIRNTFEARGYTTWDCTSPAFVKENVLYIPTAFCSYTGQALDTKTPLLRSMEIISKHAMRIVKLFGNSSSKKVVPTVGAEQEYFLIDRELYNQRLDLKICGKTLLGSKPVKGQEMEDHYCGRIRIRVSKFMNQLDNELWKLGVCSKTKHNEVAPAQHELAPFFTSANIACDHNQLIMETMRVVAKKQGLACLLHEKPFKGVNGSGKHNNWSLSTDDGQNLLEPGKTPYENMQFLLFISAIITAVDQHSDLIRLSAASIGNEDRLGGNEAPPSIISIFLGEELTSILENISKGINHKSITEEYLKIGVSTISNFILDNSDRNRTSPFAFTGNKFEFRMTGAPASIAFSTYILNTVVAESLDNFASRLESCNDFDKEVKNIITDTVKNHFKIIFNGNSYSEDWKIQSKQRNLPNFSSTLDCIKNFISQKNIQLLSKYSILSEIEIRSRYEVMIENYYKVINLESNVIIEMVSKSILPSSVEYLGSITTVYNSLLNSGNFNCNYIKNQIKIISDSIDIVYMDLEELKKVKTINFENKTHLEKAEHYKDVVIPLIKKLRTNIDYLETLIKKDYWPIPSYTELLHNI